MIKYLHMDAVSWIRLSFLERKSDSICHKEDKNYEFNHPVDNSPLITWKELLENGASSRYYKI